MRTNDTQARKIFDFPKPPAVVWEKQLDYCDGQLERVAKMPWQDIRPDDLWYYIHDLASVEELQPEVFAYLFPVCMIHWRKTLMQNQPCAVGNLDLHEAMVKGRVLQRMGTPEQRKGICAYFIDSFLDKLDEERGFEFPGMETDTFHGWLERFFEMGVVIPDMATLWQKWWSFATLGHAVAALEFASGLIYFQVENPIFRPAGSGKAFQLDFAPACEIAGQVWQKANVQFLRETLTVPYLGHKINEARHRLASEPEAVVAARMLTEFPPRRGLVREKIDDLLGALEKFRL